MVLAHFHRRNDLHIRNRTASGGFEESDVAVNGCEACLSIEINGVERVVWHSKAQEAIDVGSGRN